MNRSALVLMAALVAALAGNPAQAAVANTAETPRISVPALTQIQPDGPNARILLVADNDDDDEDDDKKKKKVKLQTRYFTE